MAGIGQDNFVVNFYVTKRFLKRIAKYEKHFSSRSALMVCIVDECLSDAEMFGAALSRRLLTFLGRVADTSKEELDDGEKISIQIVMPRDLLGRLDKYAAALGLSRAAALNTAVEVGLDTNEPFIKLWTSRAGLKVAKTIREKGRAGGGAAGLSGAQLSPLFGC